jgi:mannan endo-1,4-beta-mannosidase
MRRSGCDCPSRRCGACSHGSWVFVYRFFLLVVSVLTTLTTISCTEATAASDVFVARQGANLTLGGQPFRYAGPNMYWLGLSEDSDSYCTPACTGVHYPPHGEIDTGMNNAQTMGAKVVRSMAALSVGCPLCVQPSRGVFNANAFASIDYAIASAKQRNIRLVLPLVDNYDYFHGGKFTYLRWRNIKPDSVGSQFFTNTTVRNDFKAHITAVLNHVNPYTGLAYKNEPAIMAWETGNELSVYPNTWTHSSWTDDISRHIKVALGAQQLVVDGKYGIYTTGGTVDTASLQLQYVDIYSNHAYDTFRTPAEIAYESSVVHGSNKAFVLGEYSWTDKSTGGSTLNWTLPQMLSSIEQNGVNGDTYWELLPPGVAHGDGFTLHWPGDTTDMQNRAQQLQQHATRM